MRSPDFLPLVRRSLRLGTWPLLQRYAVAPRILRAPPVKFTETHAFCVHTRVCANDLLMCHWMLRALHRFTEGAVAVILHDDGSLRRRDIRSLAESFPGIEIIERAEGIRRLSKPLADYPNLKRWQATDYTAIKWLDVYLLGRSEYTILIDSDVLFWSIPQELFLKKAEAAWQRDIACMLHVSAQEALETFGVANLLPVNSGIGRVNRNAFCLDFAQDCWEYLFETRRLQANLAAGRPKNDDQTFHALLTARRGGYELLPESYAISWEAGTNGTVAKHYVGSYRYLLWEEGIPKMGRLLGVPLPHWLSYRP